ncbi:hypothetical protein [Luteibacter yeojuensis]|uniref:Uncharacterized protein n=1 Tax=Luteibacter yeojuensis TaxID=345309 RepID=A0A0F3KZC8_9GAMM|nr:hypothetical protein [Luteibacter yeojuensis]KJV36553.1 hypothetical protein VI08_04185 [Luteibacter yeojuensis]
MLAKTFAGILLGCPLSMAVIGLVVYLWPGSSEAVLMPWLVAFFPLWTVVIAATFMFRTGVRAWGWLAVANVGAFAALFLAKHTLPGL